MGKEPVIQRRNHGATPHSPTAEPAERAATAPAAAGPTQGNESEKSPCASAQVPPHSAINRFRKDELPAAHAGNRLVVMPVAPDRVHIYWELDPAAFATDKAGGTRPDSGQQVILRLHHAGGTGREKNASPRFFDLNVAQETRKCYVSLPEPEQTVRAELGVRTEGGRFCPFLKSNRLITPALHPAPQADAAKPNAAEAATRAQNMAQSAPQGPGEIQARHSRVSVLVPEEIVRRRIAEFYALLYKPHPPHVDAASLPPDSAGPRPDQTAVDLTELSEQRLALGTVSSMVDSSPTPALSNDP